MSNESPVWVGAKPAGEWKKDQKPNKPLFEYKRNQMSGASPVSRYFKEDGSGSYVDLLFDSSEDFNCYVLCYYDADDNKLGEEYIKEHHVRFAEDAAENWALGIKVVDFGQGV